MFLRKSWREFGKESRRTSSLGAGDYVLRSESSEPNLAATPPSTPPASSRSLSSSPPRSNNMSHGDSNNSGYPPSVPEAGTYSTPQAGSHEQPVWNNTTVNYPTEPTWGNVTPGPLSSTYDRSARLYGMGNNPAPAPNPAQFNGPFSSNPTWGSGVSMAPSQEQLMSAIWHIAQTLRNNSLLEDKFLLRIQRVSFA